MPPPKPVMNLPPASNFEDRVQGRVAAVVGAAAVEHPDALAVAVVDLDLDRLPELAAGRKLGPAVLHLVGIGRGIGIGRLGVDAIAGGEREGAGGDAGQQSEPDGVLHDVLPVRLEGTLPTDATVRGDDVTPTVCGALEPAA